MSAASSGPSGREDETEVRAEGQREWAKTKLESGLRPDARGEEPEQKLWPHAGATVTEITARLNAEGFRTARQHLWGVKTMEYVLYNYACTTPRWQAVRTRIRELHGQRQRCPAIAA
ncbi:MAG: hypothetical protein HY268_18870 [Deltaproteobacteria bacterium]|nr:hypothetical protein [Deltaproteobacteria bacterium]